MSKIIFIALLMLTTPAMAVQMMAGVGLDFQVADSDLDPQGTYGHPDGEVDLGGAAFFHIDFQVTERFGMRTGGELVQRKATQVYDEGIFFGEDGRTEYNVLSLDIPLYFEIYLGGGNHTLYVGPKLAIKLADDCSQNIQDATEALGCIDGAVQDVFVPVQIGYMLRLSEVFGLNFFMEDNALPMIDKDPLKADVFRTGVAALFYF